MLALLNLIPKWVLAALIATLAATSCKLKWDNNGLSLEIEKHATTIAQLETSIANTTADAQRQSADLQRVARQAETAATVRAAALRRDADRAAGELDRLRTALETYTAPRLTASSVTFAPGLDAADKLPELFLDCSRRYGEVARDADIWKNDAVKLYEAWPK